ncbi:MAG: hypothetical protein R3B70_33765 [Polyangiaceae bacterium]
MRPLAARTGAPWGAVALLAVSLARPARADEPPPMDPPPAPDVEPDAPFEPPPMEPAPAEPAPLPWDPPPTPIEAPPSTCCRWSVRWDPFQLLYRRVAIEAEVKIASAFSLGLEPAWIWGGGAEGLDEQGFALLGFVAWTFHGTPLRGFWVRLVGGFEAFDATLTHTRFDDVKVKQGVASGIVGAMLGDSIVIGRNGGLTLSGGIGVGVATSDTVELVAKSPDPNVPDRVHTYYEDEGRVKLLGSLGVGVTF